MSTPRPLVVFDFDGTLADTWRDIAAALNATLEEADLPPVDGPSVKHAIGEGVLPLLRKLVPRADSEPALLDLLRDQFFARYQRDNLVRTRLYAGIAECLSACSAARLVVASNKPARFLDPMVEGLGIRPRFEAVFGGDSLPARKPDPRVLHWIGARTPGPHTHVFMVGDSAIDVQTGRRAGATTIGCAWGLRGPDELRDAGVDHLVEHPREIPQLIAGPPR